VDERDRAIRNRTYGLFVELGRAPTAAEVGPGANDAWRRLHDEHAVVLDANGELLMANPFSAAPTPYRVHAGGRDWYGNCAWDAIGICAALHADGRIETTCADCGEPIALAIENGRPDDESLVFHCLVPAAHWWDDIVFT
jgi:hypothetical protein